MSSPAAHGERAKWVLVLLLALMAAARLLYATPYGMGLVNDSATYIAGARNVLAAQGYTRPAGEGGLKPITHFPPLFSLALAAAGKIGGDDPLTAARPLIAGLFALNTLLIALLVQQLSPSRWMVIFAAALFALSDLMLRLHAYVLSEPLFFTFLLLTFWLLGRYFQQPYPLWLLACGLSAALAYLTRYAGVVLFVALPLVLLLHEKDFKSRLVNIGLWATIPGLLAGLWTLRNAMVSDSIANRTLAWHPIHLEELRNGLQNLLVAFAPDWLIRLFPPLGSLYSALGLLATLGLGIALARLTRRVWPSSDETAPHSSRTLLALALVAFILTYLVFLIVSISLFDASTPLDDRILAPVHLILSALLLSALPWVLARLKGLPRLFLTVVLVILGIALVIDGVVQVQDLRKEGLGFAHREVRSLPLWAWMKTLPDEVYIYADRPAAVYLFTGRAALPLPAPIDPVKDQARADYAESLAQMKWRIHAGQAVLVLLDLHRQPQADEETWLQDLTAGLGEPFSMGYARLYAAFSP